MSNFEEWMPKVNLERLNKLKRILDRDAFDFLIARLSKLEGSKAKRRKEAASLIAEIQDWERRVASWHASEVANDMGRIVPHLRMPWNG